MTGCIYCPNTAFYARVRLKECLKRVSVTDLHAVKNPLLNPADCLLVIIDMQEKLVPAMAGKENLLKNVIKLVKFARIFGLPIILTEQQKLGTTIPEIRVELTDIEPITKLEFNCFASPSFVDQIGRQTRHNLIIAGIEAHICVAQTALYALASHTVHVVSDAIASRAPHNREIALGRMRQQGVTITSTEMVIYELMGKAGTDQFREVLALVK
jgi:isochorismate hydrolase